MTIKISVDFEIVHDGVYKPRPLSEQAVKAVWILLPLLHRKFEHARDFIDVVQIRFQLTQGEWPSRELICLKFILAKQDGNREQSENMNMLVCEFTRKGFRKELEKAQASIAGIFERQAASYRSAAENRDQLATRIRKL